MRGGGSEEEQHKVWLTIDMSRPPHNHRCPPSRKGHSMPDQSGTLDTGRGTNTQKMSTGLWGGRGGQNIGRSCILTKEQYNVRTYTTVHVQVHVDIKCLMYT